MKQEEKNRRSRELILTYAFEEFAAHGYSGAGLNQICTRGHISKGLLYHYYAGKDALYMACVERLFTEMTAALRELIDPEHVTVEGYFEARMRFFRDHPQHRQLFYDVLMYPQSHLAEQIHKCREGFDRFNDNALRALLSREKLADGVMIEEAIGQFRSFVNFLGVYVRDSSNADAEQKTSALLRTLLYGLISR